MLDYKDIITKHYALGMSGMAIAKSLNVSPSGVNDFLRAFKACDKLGYPLPQGITNYGIAQSVYGKNPATAGRDLSFEQPDYASVEKDMSSRKNMTLKVLWNRYVKQCRDGELKFYSYRQFCENYTKWCEENKETLHFNAVIGQKMEVDFAGKTFHMVDHLTGELLEIVVFVAVLPYSQLIYAEGMVSTKEPQWIAVNNNALRYFGGVPALVVCDNCKQAVIANKDWIAPELNKDYGEWAEHNHTVILPAKVRKPRYKSSVENAVGILEKGIFHDTTSAWSSSTVICGSTWRSSTVHPSRRSRTVGVTTGKRNGRNSYLCQLSHMSTWNGGWPRCPQITTSALITPITV